MPPSITIGDVLVNRFCVRPASLNVNNGGMDFPNRLRELRIRAGLTQEQLAQAMEWGGQSRVSNYEKGRGDPLFSDLPKLANTLGVTVPELFDTPGGPVTTGSHVERIDPDKLATSIEALRRVARNLEVPYDPVTHPVATAAVYELALALGEKPSQDQTIDFGARVAALLSKGDGHGGREAGATSGGDHRG